jgi:hypothetical protein
MTAGAVSMAPETMAAGAAVLARCAAFSISEGRRCRPFAFSFTNLPYFRICARLLGKIGLSPDPLSPLIEQHGRIRNPIVPKMLQMARLG